MTTVLDVHDYIVGVGASDSDAEYPPENVLTDAAREKWRATRAGATLELIIRAGATCFGIAGLNATSVIVSIGLGGRGFAVGAEDSFDLQAADSFDLVVMDEPAAVAEYDLSESDVGTLLVIYDALSVQHIASIEIVTSGDVAQAGIARAGIQRSFNQPLRGISESLKSNDVVTEMRSGAPHIDPGEPRALRQFDFEHLFTRTPDFYNYVHKIFMRNGMDPLFWRVVDAETDTVWILFAMPDGELPGGSHNHYMYTNVKTRIIEVV